MFVFALFNLQSTGRSFPVLWAVPNFCIIAHLVELVKNFLRVFEVFSRFAVALPAHCRSSRYFCIIPQAFSFVKNFFFFFQIFSLFGIFFAVLGDSSDIISLCFPFVKHFLPFFCNFFMRDKCRSTMDFLITAGQITADFRQSIPRLHAGFRFHCQIAQAYQAT